MGKLKIETKLKIFSAIYTGLLNHCSLHAALNNKRKLSQRTHKSNLSKPSATASILQIAVYLL